LDSKRSMGMGFAQGSRGMGFAEGSMGFVQGARTG